MAEHAKATNKSFLIVNSLSAVMRGLWCERNVMIQVDDICDLRIFATSAGSKWVNGLGAKPARPCSHLNLRDGTSRCAEVKLMMNDYTAAAEYRSWIVAIRRV